MAFLCPSNKPSLLVPQDLCTCYSLFLESSTALPLYSSCIIAFSCCLPESPSPSLTPNPYPPPSTLRPISLSYFLYSTYLLKKKKMFLYSLTLEYNKKAGTFLPHAPKRTPHPQQEHLTICHMSEILSASFPVTKWLVLSISSQDSQEMHVN